MTTVLLAGLLASSLQAAPLTVEDPQVWRRVRALPRVLAAEADLRASYLPGGSSHSVEDRGQGISLNSRVGVNGAFIFSGRAGGAALSFEARPLSTTRPVHGYMIVSQTLSARVSRFGDGLLIEGQAGGKPLALTLERADLPDRYVVVGRDGTRLKAWVTDSFASIGGRFDPGKLSREGLAVLGASVALMFSGN